MDQKDPESRVIDVFEVEVHAPQAADTNGHAIDHV